MGLLDYALAILEKGSKSFSLYVCYGHNSTILVVYSYIDYGLMQATTSTCVKMSSSCHWQELVISWPTHSLRR